MGLLDDLGELMVWGIWVRDGFMVVVVPLRRRK